MKNRADPQKNINVNLQILYVVISLFAAPVFLLVVLSNPFRDLSGDSVLWIAFLISFIMYCFIILPFIKLKKSEQGAIFLFSVGSMYGVIVVAGGFAGVTESLLYVFIVLSCALTAYFVRKESTQFNDAIANKR